MLTHVSRAELVRACVRARSRVLVEICLQFISLACILCACVHVCISCVLVCMCVYTYLYIYILYIHIIYTIYTYTCMHIYIHEHAIHDTRTHTRSYSEASLGDLKGYIHNYKPRLDRKPFAADVIYKSWPPS